MMGNLFSEHRRINYSKKRFIYLQSVHVKHLHWWQIYTSKHTILNITKKCIPHSVKANQSHETAGGVLRLKEGEAAHQKSSSSSLCEYAAMLGKQKSAQ